MALTALVSHWPNRDVVTLYFAAAGLIHAVVVAEQVYFVHLF